MNELQLVEFNILKEFINVCENLNLTYYLVCGSALGAAKYGGFIPWDDDIDVGMPRDDYAIFLEKAPNILPKELFLQSYESDPCHPAIFSKLRNSNTTYMENATAHLPINHGVFIDVFPLDGYPRNIEEQKNLENKKLLYTLQTYSALKMDRRWKNKLFNFGLRILGYHKRTAKVLSKYTELISTYKIETSELICNHGNWQGKLEYSPKEQYGQGIYAEFEGLRVRIPEKYDEYLTQKYGDWRADLPVDEQVGHHYYKVCDLTRPYTYYTNKKND